MVKSESLIQPITTYWSRMSWQIMNPKKLEFYGHGNEWVVLLEWLLIIGIGSVNCYEHLPFNRTHQTTTEKQMILRYKLFKLQPLACI
jgi:hypothetical protein